MAKVVFIVVAEFDGSVSVQPNMDSDTDSYMAELFYDATGGAELDELDGKLFVVPDSMTLRKAQELLERG